MLSPKRSLFTRLCPGLASLVLLAGCSQGPPAPVDAGPASSAVASSAPTASAVVTAPPAPRAPVRAPVREGGAIVRGAGEDVVYVADEDHRAVRRVPVPNLPGIPGVEVTMPGAPAQVLALDGKVLATIRDPGLLMILKPDAEKGLVEIGRVQVPADAWGIAITPDEKTALVTSAWTHKLTAVDLDAAKTRWTIDLPREPRGIVIRPDGRSAYVTHLVGGAITRVDDLGGDPRARSIELPAAPARAPSGRTLSAALAYAAVTSDDGGRLFVPRHALGALGLGSWFGAMTVDVLNTATDTPALPKRLPGLPSARHPVLTKMQDAGLVSGLEVAGADHTPVTQPRAIVYRKSTKTVIVAGEGDDRIAEFDALSPAPALRPIRIYRVGSNYDPHLQVAGSGGAPSGIALSADERTAYVFCRSTYDVVAVDLEPSNAGPPRAASSRAPDPTILMTTHLADDPLPKDGMLGRRFFYNSTDVATSGGLACAGCHPEGRDDGHVWHEAKVMSLNEIERTIFIGAPELAPNAKNNAIGFPRQTPMLAGRVGSPGPYGWHAQAKDMVERLREGFGLHRWSSGYPKGEGEFRARAHYLRAFLQTGLVTPPREERELTAQEKRGKEIFLSDAARCATCHVPQPEYTDRMAYPMPRLAVKVGFEEEENNAFKTPSLRFIGGTPPYFHDGSAPTLEALIDQNNDRMGKTNHLSKEDRAALVAFLRTL